MSEPTRDELLARIADLERRMEKIGGEDIRFLSLKATGQDLFGSPVISPICEVPVSGMYGIFIEALNGPAQAMMQLCQNEVPVGAAADLYHETRIKSGRIKLGVMELEEGKNHLMLKLAGKREKSTGLGLDLMQIICVRESKNPDTHGFP